MPTKKAASRAKAKKPTNAKTNRKQGASEPFDASREVCGVIIVCLGLLSSYFVLAGDATGFAGAVRAIMLGLAGKLCYFLPVIICWAGILVAFSARKNAANPGHIALIAGLFLILFGFVELFFVEDLLTGMREHTYISFIKAAALSQTGAGVLGALTAWIFYRSLGLRVWGSSILYIALAVVDLILMRKISLSRIREKAEIRLADYQQKLDARREDRLERRDARAAKREADRYAREQLVIPKATDTSEKPKRERIDAKDAFSQDEVFEKPTRKSARVEKIAEPLEDHVELPNSAESGIDAEADVFRSLRARKKGAKVNKPEPEALLPFDAGDLLFDPAIADGDPLSGETAVPENEPMIGPEEQDSIVTKPNPVLNPVLPTEVFEGNDEESPSDMDDDEYIPGNPLVEEYKPKKAPAQPLPSFSDQKTISLETEDTPVEAEEVAPPFAIDFEVPTKKPQVEEKHIAGTTPAPEEPPVYNYPPVDLLEMAKPSKIRNMEQLDAEKGKKLTDILLSFGITTKLTGVSHGPTVTRFELAPASGIKVSRITSLVDDIALGLAAKSVRMEAPIPGKPAIGVEVPNDEVETVPLREVLESAEAQKHPSRLAAAMGRDNAGHNIICDLAKMPHILIAGATGSGKSVCINSIICSILYRATPEEVRMILVDPKMVELSVYNGIPHLLIPVVTDPKKAAGALEWAVNEMTQRYKKFSAVGAKDIKGYNIRRPEDEPAMPQIVIIIDELADLMMVAPGDVEDAICRIAQLARAAGIHLVVATQRPSVNVITGVIKANIPSRVAFTVASQVDSRTILDVGGAEKLLMRGDMLYAPSGTNKPTRVQGCWVSENEVQAIVDYIRERHDAEYDDSLKEHLEKADMSDNEKEEADEKYDDLLPQAIEFVVDAGQASISMLQRKMRIGYARAGRLVDEMAKRGYIGEADGAKPREVLITREQFRAQFKD